MASLPMETTKMSKKDTLPTPPIHPPKSKPFPRRLVPFRHPDFTDDQIQRLTEGSQLAKDRLLKSLRKMNSSPPSPPTLSASNSSPSSSNTTKTMTTGHLTVGQANNNVQSGDGLSPGSVSPGGSGSDGELLSAVMARLVWLETNLSEAHRQLIEKEKTVTHLEEQIEILNQARAAYDGTSIYELEETCLRLHQQVNQMEKFLNEYGLVWDPDEKPLSNNCESRSSSLLDGREESSRRSSSQSQSTSPTEDGERGDNFKVDYDLVIDNIRDLNVLAGEGVPQICLSSEGARFKLIEHVPLALYSNGILLCGGPFRSFIDHNTRQCIQDLMDGYFPSELQRRYPNGVPLKVSDKRNHEFKERNSSRSGLSMNTLSLPTSRSPSLSPVSPHSPASPTTSSGSSPGVTPDSVPHISVHQLLNSLPMTVVREGKLVDVRHSITQLLKSNAHSFDFILVQTPVLQHLREGRATNPITTLRIRSETGNETYLMKFYTTDTIGDVRKYLDLHRFSDSSHYDIIALYPRRVFSRSDDTLDNCGLVPNAALYLRHAHIDKT